VVQIGSRLRHEGASATLRQGEGRAMSEGHYPSTFPGEATVWMSDSHR